MSTELPELRDYCEFLHEVQGEVDIAAIIAELPEPDGRPAVMKHRRWQVAVTVGALAAAVTVAVGIAAKIGGESPSVEVLTAEPPSTTTAPDTAAGNTQPSQAPPSTIPVEISATAPGAGDGPRIDFVEVDSPGQYGLGRGAWFRGALYALASRQSVGTEPAVLYRTTDGLSWERVEGYDRLAGERGVPVLFTDGIRLVNISFGSAENVQIDDPVRPTPMWNGCVASDGVVQVNFSTDGDTWTSSQIALAELMRSTGSSLGPDCVDVQLRGGDVGRHGFLLALEIGISPIDPFESTIAMLWSPDGQTWTFRDHDWSPTATSPTTIVATDDGFVVRVHTDEPDEQRELWRTVDGSSWEIVETLPGGFEISRWDGTIVLHNPITQLVDDPYGVRSWETGLDVLPEEAVRDVSLRFTDFGLIGLPPLGPQSRNDHTILYSADGTNWARWQLPAHEPDQEAFELVGVGEGFVVLNTVSFDPEREPRLWVGALP